MVLGVQKRFLHLPVSKKLVFILWVFVAMVIGLLALNYEAIQSVSAARAYVGGEGLWSKAQKQAVLDLLRYAASHSEKDYQRYEAALETPLGDRMARLELEKPNPDFGIVSKGFIRGRNRPEDVKGMIKLFRRFGKMRYMAEAASIWSEADGYIEHLQYLGRELHDEINAPHPSSVKIADITRKVEDVGNRLAPLEDRFSYALGEGARWTATLFLFVTFGSSALFLAMGAFFTWLMLRHLRQTDEKYKHLIDTANDAILVFEARTGIILEGNARSTELLGLPMEQAVGSSGESIFVDGDKPQFREVLARTLDGTGITGREINLVHVDGHMIPVEVNTSLTELEGKQIIQGIFRDITERKQLEEEVRQAQKMEVIGRLAGAIAHDFNNLLMVILTRVSKIVKQSDHSKIRGYAETIQVAGEKAASLTKQLLAFGRKQVLVAEVVDLNELFEEVKPLLSALPSQQIHLVMIPSTETLPVKLDLDKIEQVVMNLAVNATDAMPQGGVLKIKTSKIKRADVGPEGGLPGVYAVLEITDTGSGIDAETKSHLFEPFFTTKPSGKGTGLGLSTAYGIVKQSGGSINVDSVPGEGTTFHIFFPLVEEPIRQRKAHLERPALQGSETVILAEDQLEIRTVLVEFLESKGYKVLEAESGRDAVTLAEQYPGVIDVLVTDVIMPRLRGFDVAGEIRRLHPNVRVILISGYSEEALAENGLLSEPNAVLLQKPFEPEDLALKIRELLSESKYRGC